MPGCAVYGCSNNCKKGFRLFTFPRDPRRRRQWHTQMAKRQREDGWVPTNHSRICEAHFDDSQFEQHRADGFKKLRPNALPTLFGREIRPILTERGGNGDEDDRKRLPPLGEAKNREKVGRRGRGKSKVDREGLSRVLRKRALPPTGFYNYFDDSSGDDEVDRQRVDGASPVDLCRGEEMSEDDEVDRITTIPTVSVHEVYTIVCPEDQEQIGAAVKECAVPSITGTVDVANDGAKSQCTETELRTKLRLMESELQLERQRNDKEREVLRQVEQENEKLREHVKKLIKLVGAYEMEANKTDAISSPVSHQLLSTTPTPDFHS